MFVFSDRITKYCGGSQYVVDDDVANVKDNLVDDDDVDDDYVHEDDDCR